MVHTLYMVYNNVVFEDDLLTTLIVNHSVAFRFRCLGHEKVKAIQSYYQRCF